ncbi:MAG: phosphoglucosamine mutase [Bacteroides sp. SM23_62_1]|nr:MAG: phosphoglucosamine mutase [Bacteroides sp. SM23_62_1]
MTLIKSISGIRGTIGGESGINLTPQDIVRFASAYGAWLRSKRKDGRPTVVMGRDARISGPMVSDLVVATLLSQGIDIIQLGLAATPTVEMAVMEAKADGGVIISASHNPAEWNGLKLLNNSGEFLSAREGEEVMKIAANEQFKYSNVHSLGNITVNNKANQDHIEKILKLDLVDQKSVARSNMTIVIDGINSVGGVVVPELLERLGAGRIIKLNCRPDGLFSHNPEPLPEHLEGLASIVVKEKADVGFAVDPDGDRLVIVNEDGSMFGEEYTLVAVADYVLKCQPGSTVSNLSSTRALKDLALKYGVDCFAAAVGEVNVVEKMKEVNAVIGGEGNGGVIYPELHWGRDALIGIALFLSHLATDGRKCSEIRKDYADYYIVKHKITLEKETGFESVINRIREQVREGEINEEDGVRIDWPDGWIHVRKSNTEPVVRIISESISKEKAYEQLKKIKDHIY